MDEEDIMGAASTEQDESTSTRICVDHRMLEVQKSKSAAERNHSRKTGDL